MLLSHFVCKQQDEVHNTLQANTNVINIMNKSTELMWGIQS